MQDSSEEIIKKMAEHNAAQHQNPNPLSDGDIIKMAQISPEKIAENNEYFKTNPLLDPNTKIVDTTKTGKFALSGKNCMTRRQFDHAATTLFVMALKAIAMTKGGHKCNKIALATLKEYEIRCKTTIFVPEPDNAPTVGHKFKAPDIGPDGEPIEPPVPSGSPDGSAVLPSTIPMIGQNAIMDETSKVEGFQGLPSTDQTTN